MKKVHVNFKLKAELNQLLRNEAEQRSQKERKRVTYVSVLEDALADRYGTKKPLPTGDEG
jgi:gamma-glutamylcysteine synthetase